ncbi:acyl-CoA thioesterase [Pseudenhygromyxa sp. WMMC2535]|uniref:acyl-CoA thioesterase n=1 Tax=Pseudenhygromyxa sp. WMMC2535 TaxID=2712867 RepID=UPI001555C0A3|nr:acyl-CoA thioesterase [Pseudenhygromyxa sp. WMMC2535]NVB42545.1 acyl-CoA thioesterase [Pseudenhygromyxa sp. WMMC2535]
MSPSFELDPQPAIRVTMMPADTNAHGTIFGGKILSLIDQAGAIAAHRIGVGRVVTVAMRECVFKHPVRVGDIVSCYADVLKVGKTSITVCVRVVAHRPTDVKRSVEVTKAEAIYVHIDEAGRPIPIAEGEEV